MALRIGSQGSQVSAWQQTMRARFASYAIGSDGKPLKVDAYYGNDDAQVQSEYQRRTKQPVDGIVSDHDLQSLGIIGTPVTETPPAVVAYACPGTWGIWNDGPHWWTCERLDGKKVYSQGVQWNTGAFLQPDPQHSYVEARNEGTAELLRLALPDPRPKVWIGYSMGADVVVRALYAWPANRRSEILQVVTFGSPCHPPGWDETGSESQHGGISRVYTPEWARERELAYSIPGDMYSDAPGLLPFFYEVLTRMEISGEFVFYLFSLLTGLPTTSSAHDPLAPINALGRQLLGLGQVLNVPGFGALSGILGLITPGPTSVTNGPVSLFAMLSNIPELIQTLLAAMKFIHTGAHMKYGGTDSAQIFGGTDAVIDAAARITAIAT